MRCRVNKVKRQCSAAVEDGQVEMGEAVAVNGRSGTSGQGKGPARLVCLVLGRRVQCYLDRFARGPLGGVPFAEAR